MRRVVAGLLVLSGLVGGVAVVPEASAAVVAQESVLTRVDGDHLTWFVRRPAGTGWVTQSFVYGLAGDHPVWGDWDGNGTFTPGVVRGTTWLLRNSNSAGAANVQFAFGTSGDRPITGDWDGNGTWTPGVVRSNMWLLRNSNSNGAADGSSGGGGRATPSCTAESHQPRPPCRPS